MIIYYSKDDIAASRIACTYHKVKDDIATSRLIGHTFSQMFVVIHCRTVHRNKLANNFKSCQQMVIAVDRRRTRKPSFVSSFSCPECGFEAVSIGELSSHLNDSHPAVEDDDEQKADIERLEIKSEDSIVIEECSLPELASHGQSDTGDCTPASPNLACLESLENFEDVVEVEYARTKLKQTLAGQYLVIFYF